MRRTYISPEFDYSNIWGTYNMREESTFFASKMLEIEDELVIDDGSLVYFQKSNKEQLDISIESSLPSISYSSDENKRVNHTITIDDSQSSTQKDNKCRYILDVDLRTILTNHIFATLKRWRTFEGVKNTMTRTSDVDFAIKEYITKNVFDRYKLSKVELYLKYNQLNNQAILKYNNVWSGYTDPITGRSAILPSDITTEKNLVRNIETNTEYDQSRTLITFNQGESAKNYNFDYYFKLFYEKI
jgi:hypothetical protein